ncbi:TPA: 50S ribosomal protein L20 [Candidatus Dependentiae bacterium]|nr:MAG: 50S ribosomal protein L20 [candidate division TM6 bacterium GW2011_GWF2_43_87]HBL98705.1 50S ribosomal protein L20 [Candidatus Dependentiae bacterium]
MTRVKRGVQTRKRHKRLFKQAEGFWGQRKNVFRRAKETYLRAMAYAFKGRKLKKRDMRGLFISRISAAVENHGFKYGLFIHGLKTAQVQLNRKMLSQIAIFDDAAFTQLIGMAKK